MKVLNINDYIEYDLSISTIVSAFERRCSPNWRLEERSGRPCNGFVYVLDGSADFTSDEGNISVSKGEILFLSKESKYTTYGSRQNPYSFYVVSFHFYENDNHPFNHLEKIINASGYPYKNTFNELVNVWFYKGIGYKMKCKSILTDILYHAMLDSVHSNINTENLHKIKPSVDYMEQYYNKQMNIEQLAFMSRLSPTHFRRLFKEIYRVSPLQYLNSIRINKAKDLILTDMYSIGEISEMTGFSDISYFSRVFRKNTGIPPSSFNQ